MQGTDKQIKWAEQIKTEMMGMINATAAKFSKAAEGRADQAKMESIIAKTLEIIESRPASYWIDNRSEKDGVLDTKAALRVWAEAAKEAAAQ